MSPAWIRPERSFPTSETAIRERAFCGLLPEIMPTVDLTRVVIAGIRHGRKGYNRGCRCLACTEANRMHTVRRKDRIRLIESKLNAFERQIMRNLVKRQSPLLRRLMENGESATFGRTK